MHKSGWTLLAFIVIGGFLGSLLGEILIFLTPKGIVQDIFSHNYIYPGFDIRDIDLVFLKLNFGFHLKMNLLTFLGIILGFYLYKNI